MYMSEDTTTQQTQQQTAETASQQGGGQQARQRSRGGQSRRGGNQRGGSGRRGKRFVKRSERPRPEFDQKILSIRRVSRVVAGGRRFSFSVTIALGDGKGAVGVGTAKAGDTAQAIEKASNEAKKHMIVVPQTETGSIPHAVRAKFCASNLMMQPSPGRGLVAGSSVRNVLQLAGITDVVAKLLSRSQNRLNNAQAAMRALGRIEGVRRYEDVQQEKKAQRQRQRAQEKEQDGEQNKESAGTSRS